MRTALVLAVIVAGLELLACARRAAAPVDRPWVPEATVTDLGPVVARVGEVPIFAAEVSAQAAASGKAPRAALDELIAFHLLAERRRGDWPPRDAAGAALRDEILVQRMIEREIEPRLTIDQVPEQDLRRIYEKIKPAYVHPRLVEVSVLSVWPGIKATREQREQGRVTARELEAALDAMKEKTPEALEELGRRPEWAARSVRVFRFIQVNPGEPYPKEFHDAVVKLSRPGDTTPIVEDRTGFHIARFVSARPASDRSFAEVRGEIRDKYYPDWRKAQFTVLTAKLAERHKIEVHADLVHAAPPPGP